MSARIDSTFSFFQKTKNSDHFEQFEYKLFSKGFYILSSHIFENTFDIDGDGKDEQCTLSAGPTSGLFTFIFSVSENGNLECFNIFNSAAMNLHFEKNAEGVMMLVGKVGDKTRYMGMDVSDGNIVISSDEQDISYWGEQGLN